MCGAIDRNSEEYNSMTQSTIAPEAEEARPVFKSHHLGLLLAKESAEATVKLSSEDYKIIAADAQATLRAAGFTTCVVTHNPAPFLTSGEYYRIINVAWEEAEGNPASRLVVITKADKSPLRFKARGLQKITTLHFTTNI